MAEMSPRKALQFLIETYVPAKDLTRVNSRSARAESVLMELIVKEERRHSQEEAVEARRSESKTPETHKPSGTREANKKRDELIVSAHHHGIPIPSIAKTHGLTDEQVKAILYYRTGSTK